MPFICDGKHDRKRNTFSKERSFERMGTPRV